MPVLVVGSLAISVGVSVATAVERPYPGYALGSGVVLVLERAAMMWAFALVVLVISDQALRGRLPVEISGRGVRYADRAELVDLADGGDSVTVRLDELEAAFEAFKRGT